MAFPDKLIHTEDECTADALQPQNHPSAAATLRQLSRAAGSALRGGGTSPTYLARQDLRPAAHRAGIPLAARPASADTFAAADTFADISTYIHTQVHTQDTCPTRPNVASRHHAGSSSYSVQHSTAQHSTAEHRDAQGRSSALKTEKKDPVRRQSAVRRAGRNESAGGREGVVCFLLLLFGGPAERERKGPSRVLRVGRDAAAAAAAAVATVATTGGGRGGEEDYTYTASRAAWADLSPAGCVRWLEILRFGVPPRPPVPGCIAIFDVAVGADLGGGGVWLWLAGRPAVVVLSQGDRGC
ncbi:uncharacterized protein B0H64DRAFT_117628 [Chaetomium fimeti]|uniref:Uncharacterized protein n=1 Tax=Chaetomium fimeti TaxID=1854472 RepID=A0AAE0HIB7_9PEZI|nr:hypothetical protein B0H64DRAFT_117628 [Chaetomium fimeti]